MKTCTKCKETKDFTCFGKSMREVDHLRTWCKSCYNTSARNFYKNNSETIKNRAAIYFEKNREEQNRLRRLRRLANLESERIAGQKWASANPDKTRAYKSKNRAKRILIQAEGNVLVSDIKKLLKTKSCFYCRKNCKPTIDHVVPLSKGGKHSLGNLVVACSSCNSSKGSKLFYEWKLYLLKAPF